MSLLIFFLQTNNFIETNDLIKVCNLHLSLNNEILICLRENSKKYIDEKLEKKLSNKKLENQKAIKKSIQNNIFYYSDIFFNFNVVKSKLITYDNILYIDDTWNYDLNSLKSNITVSKKILRRYNKSVDQIIFSCTNSDENQKSLVMNSTNVSKTLYKSVKLDEYNIFRRITNHNNILNIKNPYKKTLLVEIDYLKYINKIYNDLQFNLRPSLINTDRLYIDNNSLQKNDYLEKLYAEKLEEHNFSSVYLNNKNIYRKNQEKSIIVENKRGKNITIVTAFINLNITRPPKKGTNGLQIYDYFEKSKDTLQIKQNMVIYVTKDLVEKVKTFREKHNLLEKTKIVEITKEKNLYLYDQIDKIRENVKKNNKPYNIAEYILAVNSRYNLIKNAIESNYFNNDYYAWIDFSAGHIVNIPTNLKISYSREDKIRIALIGRKHKSKSNFDYNYKCLGGGIFAGHKEIMLELIKIHDIEFRSLMNLGYCINDDKLLFTIYEKYPQLFDIYVCGYKSLLTNL